MSVLTEKIVNLLYKGVTARGTAKRILTPLMGLLFFCLVLFSIIASFYIDQYFGFPKIFSKPFALAAALPVLLIGAALWLWPVWFFFKEKGTPVPISPPPRLITHGPYAYSRNPMMTGIFLLLFGLGVLFRSLSLTFIVTPLFVFFSILEFKFIEEPELEKRFGKAYADYRAKTPLIIPKIFRSGT